jgi:uracil-DNA glycosylase
MADERGDPWEHDPGPTTASGWAALFAETPNYRGLGRAVVGREAFRWHHGPMFFRGRLDGSAKVVLVGQEGAQDESLSHRSFTGGTGARMQHLLRHLGLDRSYLFLNSFVYPIFGQYTDDLRPLAQDRRSPIVAHRHRILDMAVVDGDVRLVVAVGRAAKESIATWIGAHGGSANPERLEQAGLGSLPARLRVVGVVHPGSAAGGSTGAIRADFQRACDVVRERVEADPGWLPADPGVARNLAAPFQYRSAAIPFRDFPFGTCPRLGRGGTSSNRTDNQRGIQLFSAAGRYNAAGEQLRYGSTAGGSRDGYDDDAGDLPYEPPRAAATAFDPGPPASLARLLLGAEPGFGWPDFAALGVTAHPSFGVGGGLPGPVPRPEPARPGRPGLQRRPVLWPGPVRGGRPAAGAVPARRRADPPVPDRPHPAGRHPRPLPEPPQQPGRPAGGPGAAPRAAAAGPGREPAGRGAAGPWPGGPAPRPPAGSARHGGHPPRRRRQLRSGRLLAGGP